MSHQIVITFDLDENQVAENAAKEAGRQVAQKVLKEIFGDSYIGSYSSKRNASDFLRKEVKEFLLEYKEEIVDAAIKEVSKTLSRTKIVRNQLQEELDGNGEE